MGRRNNSIACGSGGPRETECRAVSCSRSGRAEGPRSAKIRESVHIRRRGWRLQKEVSMVESGSCFVAIPASQTVLRQVIRDALGASGIQMLGDEEFGRTSLPVRRMQHADLMIADITGSSPHVFYDLGVADALRKPSLVIAQKPSDFPGDFAGHKVVTYGPEEFEKLSGFIQYWVRETLESSASQPFPVFNRPVNIA